MFNIDHKVVYDIWKTDWLGVELWEKRSEIAWSAEVFLSISKHNSTM